MTKKRVFVGIIGIMLMFTAGAANAETIAAYFQCRDDDATPGDSISLGSDGSCIIVIGGERARGTYVIDKVPGRGDSGNITFYIDGASDTVMICWPMNERNLLILIGGWTFERRR